MKVIFLDIDGVLNCATTPNPRKFPYTVDPKLLKRFKRLLQRTGAKVVLSSTWRYDPAGIFSAKHWGVPFIDVIPDMPHRPRRDEVIAWLKVHPKVKRFVVIDDEDDELDQLPLFQPSASTGLTETIAKGVANYLDGKTDEDMRCTLWCECCKTLNPLSKVTRADSEGRADVFLDCVTSRLRRPEPALRHCTLGAVPALPPCSPSCR